MRDMSLDEAFRGTISGGDVELVEGVKLLQEQIYLYQVYVIN